MSASDSVSPVFSVAQPYRATIVYAVALGAGLLVILIALGWRLDSLPFQPGVQFSDAPTAHYPNAYFLREQILGGQLPIWRDTFMGGQPFLANPLNKAFYPPQYLVLLLPPILHLNVLLWLHLTLAGVGMRVAARSFGLSEVVSNTLGVAFALTPRLFAAGGAGHLDVVYACGWLPWLVWAARTAAYHHDLSVVRRAVTFGIVAALSVHADIRISVFNLGLAAVLLAVPLSGQRISDQRLNRRGLMALIGGFALLALLTAPSWILLLRYAPELTRAGLSSAEANIDALLPVQLLAFFAPRPPGTHEQVLYIGLIVSIFAAGGLIMAVMRTKTSATPVARWIAFLTGLIVLFAALYATGSSTFLWSSLTQLIPPLIWLRVPPRIWIIAVFMLLLLAGYGLSAITDRRVLIVIAMLIIAELLYTDSARLTFQPRAIWLDRYAPIAEALKADGGYKFYSPTYSIPTQATAYYGLQDLGGVDPFQFAAYIPVFEQATNVKINGYSITLPPYQADPATSNRDAQPDPVRLARLGVDHVVVAYPLTVPGLQFVTQITVGTDSTFIYRVAP